MSLEPGGIAPPEAPERSVVHWYTIDSGIAAADETGVRQPSATVRFVQVLQLQDDGPVTNAFGMPAYRLAEGGFAWGYEVPLQRLRDALVAAEVEVVTRIATLLQQGQTAPQVVATTAAEGYPELALRKQIDAIESERRAGALEVLHLRMFHGGVEV